MKFLTIIPFQDNLIIFLNTACLLLAFTREFKIGWMVLSYSETKCIFFYFSKNDLKKIEYHFHICASKDET